MKWYLRWCLVGVAVAAVMFIGMAVAGFNGLLAAVVATVVGGTVNLLATRSAS